MTNKPQFISSEATGSETSEDWLQKKYSPEDWFQIQFIKKTLPPSASIWIALRFFHQGPLWLQKQKKQTKSR